MRVDPTRWTFLNLLSPHLQKHRDPPQDALVGWFTGPEGRPYAMLVNQLHGQGKSAWDTADTIELESRPRSRRWRPLAGSTGRPTRWTFPMEGPPSGSRAEPACS